MLADFSCGSSVFGPVNRQCGKSGMIYPDPDPSGIKQGFKQDFSIEMHDYEWK
jgi:hypothetical protein